MNILPTVRLALIFSFFSTSLLLNGQTGTPPTTIEVKNEEVVNSKGLEFSPTFYEDGIIFISTNSAGIKKVKDDKLKLPAMTILRSKRNAEGGLSKPEPFAKELSTRFHEGPVCFNPTGDKVYFSRNILVNGREKHAKDGEQKMKLYESQKSGESWSEAIPLPINTDEYDDCHPSLSIDGDKIFFASDRPGGFGGMDLYVAFKLGDSWSEPVNLGQSVNTAGNEAFPFIHADNTLYFSSDGQNGGIGGFDMYYALPEGSNWTKPVNIGTPFNTKGDDFGLIVDLDKINGYYSSNGNGGLGGDDIFSFHTENGNLDDYLLQNNRGIDQEVDLLTTVFDQATNAPLAGATVRILNLDQNNVIGRDAEGNLITLQNINGKDVMKIVTENNGVSGTTDAGGRFSTNLKPGNYVILVSKEGYQTKQITEKIFKTGNENIVSLEKATGKVRWNAALFNDQTNAPLAGATLVLTNKQTGKQEIITTDGNGNVDYYLDANSDYKVDIYKNDILIGSTQINTTGWENGNGQGKMALNVANAPLPTGTVIELPSIYYNYNDATLRPEARKDLSLVLSILQQYPNIKLEVGSHTDSRGTDEYNLDLSRRRAENVIEYLASKGASTDRLSPMGYGETKIRNKCTDGANCSEKEHARNRRTEITVLGGADGVTVKKVEGSLGIGKRYNEAPGGGVVVSGYRNNADYYVIAGSFLMENRAIAQAGVIRNAGFQEVEVKQFHGTPFYSVVVKKTDAMDEAQSIKHRIETEAKLSAFVKAVPR